MRGRASSTSGRRRRGGRLAARVEAGLWCAGVLLLGTALWMAVDAAWYQRQAREQLHADALAATSATTTPAATTATGTPIARLLVPRLALDVVVAEGDDDDVLRRAVGRVPGGARFGEEAGNVMLAGHRDTFFRPLERIRTGDLVIVERETGRDVYRVEWAAVVEPTRVELRRDAGYAALTLVTCYPFRYVGEAPYRFVVRARRVDAPAGETAAG
jgi:sortase A